MKGQLFFIFQSCSYKTEAKDEIAFYISLNVNDSQNGKSIENSFATIEKARNTIRNLKKNGKLNKSETVYLQGGSYQISKPIILTAEDSGTEEFPITYHEYENEKPITNGGLPVREWTNTKLNGCNLLVSNLSKIERYVLFEQLWVNSYSAVQTRITNNGYLKVSNTKGDDTKYLKRNSTYNFAYYKKDEAYFKDPVNGDFSLLDNSSTLQIGFKLFPLGLAESQ